MKVSSCADLLKVIRVRPAMPFTVLVTELLTELMPLDMVCEMAPESIETESMTFKMELLTVLLCFSSNDCRNSGPPNTGISSKV